MLGRYATLRAICPSSLVLSSLVYLPPQLRRSFITEEERTKWQRLNGGSGGTFVSPARREAKR